MDEFVPCFGAGVIVMFLVVVACWIADRFLAGDDTEQELADDESYIDEYLDDDDDNVYSEEQHEE